MENQGIAYIAYIAYLRTACVTAMPIVMTRTMRAARRMTRNRLKRRLMFFLCWGFDQGDVGAAPPTLGDNAHAQSVGLCGVGQVLGDDLVAGVQRDQVLLVPTY